jgi:Cu(I)/Ag(I) efflux system membrane protein CusA/SilA
MDVERVVKDVPGTVSAYAERPIGGRYVDVDIDRRTAARYGLNVADVQQIVRTAIGGEEVTRSVEGVQRFPVNLRYAQQWRDSPDALAGLPIVTPSGAHIVLGDIARIGVKDGPGMIRTENARLNGWVFVDIAPGRDLGSYVADARSAVAQAVTLPPGYSLAWSGQFEYLLRVKERLLVVAPLTIALIVVLLWLTFKRAADVLIVMLSLPVALSGGVWLLWWLGYNFSVAVAVGFIALAGVAVETAIVMLVYLDIAWRRREREAREAGRPSSIGDVRDAVIEGALLRLRPKAMTVATILAGLFPIMVGSGTGSEVMRRIAAPMVGGMVTATALTLFVIPALFIVWQRFRLRRPAAVPAGDSTVRPLDSAHPAE